MDFLRVAAAALFALAGMVATAAAQTPSPADQQCLACHGMPGLEKKLANGETLPLQIAGDDFSKSVHAPLGCATCHSDVQPGTNHPPAENNISSRRTFSMERVQVCQTCHTQQTEEWGKSVHAALARDNNAIAPICTSCHNPHAVMQGAAATIDAVPCKTCHADIFTAYSGSMHGQLRGAGITAAPLCFDCHGAHGINVASAGEGVKPRCLGCHTGALNQHRTWLPNADLHFDVVSCPACHAPTAQRKVDLVLYNSATQSRIPEPVGVPAFDDGSSGLDPRTLMTLLGALNHPGMQGKTTLKGRLTVQSGPQAHELAPAAQAISDCKTCHAAGAAAFKTVTVSVAGSGGVPIDVGANGTVLNSALSLQSVGGFYAIGGTRIGVLDILFLLAVLGGVAVPVGHLMMKYAVRIYLARHRQGRKEG
jgi:hypothetical protein